MAESFSILQITRYLQKMRIKISHMDYPRNTIELAFHDEHGQWKMIVGIHQSGSASKLMLIVPHFGTLIDRKRVECLEALMAVNYRIALGKFGVDPSDDEIRLEESIPLAKDSLTFEQFRLVFNAITQTVSIYHSLLSRIIYGGQSVQDALQSCEEEFFQTPASENTAQPDEQITDSISLTPIDEEQPKKMPDLDLNEIMAEVTWLLGQRGE